MLSPPSAVASFWLISDVQWESFTLGRAPATSDLAVATPGAGSRYLVQRWGDGTMCDRTGRSRLAISLIHLSLSYTDHNSSLSSLTEK